MGNISELIRESSNHFPL